MTNLVKSIKHFEGLQKRYTTQHNGKMCEMVDCALMAMNEVKWTPVSEGLPTESKNYNVSCRSGNKEWTTTMVWLNGLFGNSDSFNNLVIAWKPMPEPYKEEITKSIIVEGRGVKNQQIHNS